MSNQHDRSYGERREPPQGFERTAGSYQDDDPLAELARLVGQKDPFETFYPNDDRPRRGEASSGSDDPRAPKAASHRLPYGTERPEPGAGDLARSEFPRESYAAEAPEAEPPLHDDAVRAQPTAHLALDPSWQSEARAAEEPRAAEWEDGPGYLRPPKPEEALAAGAPAVPRPSEPPRREVRNGEGGRRKAFAIAAALVGVAVLGGGAAVAYRAIGGGMSDEPPLIKAEPGPAKIAASDAGAAPVQAAPQVDPVQERLVPREERVAALPESAAKQPVRVPLPGATETKGADLEPKKVRTLIVKPDGTVVREDTGAVTIPPAPAMPATAQPAGTPKPVEPARQPVASDAAPAETAAPAPPARSRMAALRPQAPAASSGETERKTAASSSSPWAVQLTSQKSQAQAQAAFTAMQKKHRAVLGDKQPEIVKADLGDKGTVYRVRVGAESQEAANKLCSSLKSAGAGCFVQRN